MTLWTISGARLKKPMPGLRASLQQLVAVAAFAGTTTAAPLDQGNNGAASDSAVTLQPGSITPGFPGEVAIVGCSMVTASSVTVPGNTIPANGQVVYNAAGAN